MFSSRRYPPQTDVTVASKDGGHHGDKGMLGAYMDLMSVTDAIYQVRASVTCWWQCSGVVRSLGFSLQGWGVGQGLGTQNVVAWREGTAGSIFVSRVELVWGPSYCEDETEQELMDSKV